MSDIIHFPPFYIISNLDLLYRDDVVIPLEPKIVRVLYYLAINHQRIISKAELLEHIWPDVFTTEYVLTRAISQARRALGDSPSNPQFIKTYHARGYQFIAPVGLERDKTLNREIEIGQKLPNSGAVPAVPQFVQFVGREREMCLLQAEYQRALEGKARPVVILGNAGIGKTQLITRFRDWAAQQGAMVLMGKFFDFGGSVTEPLRLFNDMFLNLLKAEAGSGDKLREFTANDKWQHLTNAALPGVPRKSDKWRLFETLTDILATLAKTRPILLMLDDLQWADEISLDFIGYLLRNLTSDRFFFVGTARSEEAQSRGQPLRAWLMAQSRYYYETVELAPFDCATIDMLLRSTFHLIEISSKEVALLARITGGNPFYLAEVIRLLVSRGKIWYHAGIWRSTPFDEVAIPDTITHLVRYKLEGCDEELRELLAQAAVIGDSFSFDLLREVSARDERTLEELLERGIKAFLFCEEGNAVADNYRFYHSMIRLVVYEEIPRRQRRRLHAQVAAALVKMAGDEKPTAAAALAYHYCAAGDWPRAFKQAVAAVEHCWQQVALDEMIRYSKYAEEASGHLGDQALPIAHQQIIAQIKLWRATALLKLGRFVEAESEIEQTRAFIDRLASPVLAARYYPLLTELCYWRGRYGEGISIAETGLDLARAVGDETCARRILYYQAWCLVRRDDLRQARAIFLNVAEISARAGDTNLQGHALIAYGEITHFFGEWRQARTAMKEARRLARTGNDRHLECLTLLFCGWISEYECQFKAVEQCYQEGLKVARTYGWRKWEGYLHLVAGRTQLRLPCPDLARAEELLIHSMAIMEEANDISGRVIVAPLLALVAARARLSLTTVEQLRAAAASAAQYGQTIDYCEILCELGSAQQQLQLWQQARETYQGALVIAVNMSYAHCRWRAHYGLAQCCLQEGAHGAALEHLGLAIAIIGQLAQQLDTPDEVAAFMENKRAVFAAQNQARQATVIKPT